MNNQAFPGPDHDPALTKQLAAITARHSTSVALPMALALIATAVMIAIVFNTLDLGSGHSSGVGMFKRTDARYAAGATLTIGVLFLNLLLSVKLHDSRVESRKRRVLAEVAGAYPDPKAHDVALAALRDLPHPEGSFDDVLSSIQNDLRKSSQFPAGGTAAAPAGG